MRVWINLHICIYIYIHIIWRGVCSKGRLYNALKTVSTHFSTWNSILSYFQILSIVILQWRTRPLRWGGSGMCVRNCWRQICLSSYNRYDADRTESWTEKSRACIHVYVYVCICMYLHIVLLYACMYTRVCMRICYVYVYACIYIYVVVRVSSNCWCQVCLSRLIKGVRCRSYWIMNRYTVRNYVHIHMKLPVACLSRFIQAMRRGLSGRMHWLMNRYILR